NGADGEMANTNVCVCAGGITAAVLGVPVTTLVCGSVVWNEKPAGIDVWGEMQTPRAGDVPALMTLANAVAGPPTCTERLEGNADATRGWLAPCVLSKTIASRRFTDGPSFVMAPVTLLMVMREVSGGVCGPSSTPYRVPTALKAMAPMANAVVPPSIATR